MIVRNEETSLPGCLQSCADLFDELVIVDTGSTDATKEMGRAFGARLFDFPWCDDFSAARNESLRHATGEWVMWMDADDRLDQCNRDKLRSLLANCSTPAIYGMHVVSRAAWGPADRVRLFPRSHAIWKRRVHEVVRFIDRPGSIRVVGTDIVIHHLGYDDPARRRAKNLRNLRLLQLAHAERPNDPVTMYNLGQLYLAFEQGAEALFWLRKSQAAFAAAGRSVPADLSRLLNLEVKIVRARSGIAIGGTCIA
jgi:glycosyltransferase involved in cell wall biosynthesis